MPYDFHKDKQVYFEHQYRNSQQYIVPFIEKIRPVGEPMRVLEIGCAEGGVLKAFTDLGCICTGIELKENRLELAREFMATEIETGKIRFIARDIYDIDVEKDLPQRFDLIILKDVIEHIHDQEKLLNRLHDYLAPGGSIFFGFPPWYMPFGGHQQMCANKKLAKLPYFHLLPMPLYRSVLRLFGETEVKVENLAEIKETGISIERFERIIKRSGYRVDRKIYYLVNPIYKYKFKLEPREQFPLLSVIPFARNFITTAMYYLVTPLVEESVE
jgi:SAM-dependent methyltransferase